MCHFTTQKPETCLLTATATEASNLFWGLKDGKGRDRETSREKERQRERHTDREMQCWEEDSLKPLAKAQPFLNM